MKLTPSFKEKPSTPYSLVSAQPPISHRRRKTLKLPQKLCTSTASSKKRSSQASLVKVSWVRRDKHTVWNLGYAAEHTQREGGRGGGKEKKRKS
ncbi:hypothetical protein T440DRAFT_471430 [Plenodomus tracheiphilus IPT5]|uniref:Uncharacterized protein n=1 Tax=Plenodomus tracheiphilus IPT5 TaxID=1408161 RepID=A0A6A7AXJ0_9PLEO|nr:hypothetical protein T440DRAFT_471430 [Plenodomus tracheiphilus IPT5]